MNRHEISPRFIPTRRVTWQDGALYRIVRVAPLSHPAPWAELYLGYVRAGMSELNGQ